MTTDDAAAARAESPRGAPEGEPETASSARLRALHATGLLDGPPEPAFDRLTGLARRLLRAPVALVSLVDRDRQFFKSGPGLPEPWASRRETPLSHSFCRHVVAAGEPLVVGDARRHPLVRDNPAIRDLGVVAYLGVPLLTPDGHALGSLCAIDDRPRDWSAEDIATLSDLAAMTMTEVAARLHLRERERAERALRERNRALEALNRANAAIAAELDLERLVQLVTDAGTELTGAGFGAFFYNTVDEEAGGAYRLYTLSGLPREAFARFAMPRATAVFGPTFRGEGVVRADDITRDPRYGRSAPHRGMPEGHPPVRSYLAAPVVSRSGEILGGLFFGHPEPGVFTPLAERLVVGIAAQAAVAIDNARLYERAQHELAERTRAEEQQRLLAAELAHRVKNTLAVVESLAERTGERADTVADFLAAFRGRVGALAAAHDLLTASSWRGADLRDLARGALAAHLDGDGRVRVEVGADLTLTPTAAQTLVLVLHELATNAQKYGALSTPGGRVRLTAAVRRATAGSGAGDDDPDGELHVVWEETGGPPVTEPERTGFGTVLLKRMIAYQHGGRVEVDWREAGLVCRLHLPLGEIAEPRPA